MTKGLFIVIEGLDGSGTSTQCELLRNYLTIKGLKVIVTKEPTNNLIGGLIRGVLTKDWDISPQGLQLLFCADRAHHLEKEIMPALEKGTIVICDRYLFSTLAFGALQCDMEWLKVLNQNFLLPNLAFILDVNPSVCVQRIGSGRERFELFEEEQKLQRVSENYNFLTQHYLNMIIVNGQREKEAVLIDIVRKVEELLAKDHSL